MMFMTQQVLTTLGWVVLVLAISPMLWLLFHQGGDVARSEHIAQKCGRPSLSKG